MKIDIFNHVMPQAYLELVKQHSKEAGMVKRMSNLRMLWDIEHRVEMRRVEAMVGNCRDRLHQFVGIRKHVVPGHLRELPARQLEHRLRRRIRKRDAQRAFFQYQHDGRQGFEARQQAGFDKLHIVRQRLAVSLSCLDQILQYHLAVRR